MIFYKSCKKSNNFMQNMGITLAIQPNILYYYIE